MRVSKHSISIGMGSGAFRKALSVLKNCNHFKSIDRQAAQTFGNISHVWVRGNTAPSNPHTKIISSFLET